MSRPFSCQSLHWHLGPKLTRLQKRCLCRHKSARPVGILDMPSQSIFCDHCECVSQRHDLSGDLIHREEGTAIRYGPVRDILTNDNLFTVITSNTICHARPSSSPLVSPTVPVCPRSHPSLFQVNNCHPPTPPRQLPRHRPATPCRLSHFQTPSSDNASATLNVELTCPSLVVASPPSSSPTWLSGMVSSRSGT